jgi:quinol monooxygenase YgiN
MKIELETIPVWDGVKSNSECFLCDLMQQSEHHAVSYYLGSSVMHPETRVRVHQTGFCPTHWESLVQAGKPQALALIGHTYLQHTVKGLESPFHTIAHAKSPRKTRQGVQAVDKQIAEHEKGCLICSDMQSRLDRYNFTLISLWRDDREFREEFTSGKGVCVHHMGRLLAMAEEALKGAQISEFSAELVELVQRNLKRLEDDVWWMTQKYKAEHRDAPWNGCEDAHKRLVHKLIGSGRIVSDS